jgi:hypothetical protein
VQTNREIALAGQAKDGLSDALIAATAYVGLLTKLYFRLTNKRRSL